MDTKIDIDPKDLPRTNPDIWEEQGGEIMDPETMSYLIEQAGNSSGLAKVTIDLNVWEVTGITFNNGESWEVGFHPARGGYFLGIDEWVKNFRK